ncbi:MAG: hypothetical protein N4A35_06630 [Flavobacteriales bacterium]|jgi:hypothetical protein|nr:hypothetical protein [Flavobacteriales bacterium]
MESIITFNFELSFTDIISSVLTFLAIVVTIWIHFNTRKNDKLILKNEKHSQALMYKNIFLSSLENAIKDIGILSGNLLGYSNNIKKGYTNNLEIKANEFIKLINEISIIKLIESYGVLIDDKIQNELNNIIFDIHKDLTLIIEEERFLLSNLHSFQDKSNEFIKIISQTLIDILDQVKLISLDDSIDETIKIKYLNLLLTYDNLDKEVEVYNSVIIDEFINPLLDLSIKTNLDDSKSILLDCEKFERNIKLLVKLTELNSTYFYDLFEKYEIARFNLKINMMILGRLPIN